MAGIAILVGAMLGVGDATGWRRPAREGTGFAFLGLNLVGSTVGLAGQGETGRFDEIGRTNKLDAGLAHRVPPGSCQFCAAS